MTIAPPTRAKGLKAGAVGFWDAVSIGVDSTAPAYTIAAVLGSIALVAGTRTPAVLIVSFVPMVCIAGAFLFMNRVDPDCGTTFSWVTRTMGPWWGWMAGWAVFSTGVLVVGAQADVAVTYGLVLLGADDLAASRPVVVLLTCLVVLALTWLSVRGTEMSARFQRLMVVLQVAALALLVVAGLGRMLTGTAPAGAPAFSLSWFDPTGLSPSALVSGMLLGVFCYWGWESAVNLNEESHDAARSPGRAGLVATVILLVVYVGVAVAVLGVVDLETLGRFDDDEALFGVVGRILLGPFDRILVLSIVVSGLAATQTTIIPASRASLSMAAARAFPGRFLGIHPRYGTPAFGTWVVGIAAIVWYIAGSVISQNFLFDSLSALSIVVAFYYALTGLACTLYWRRHLRDSAAAFLLLGVGPVAGALVLAVLLGAAMIEYADPATSYSETAVLGMGAPLAMALLIFVAGAVLMTLARLGDARPYFDRRGGEVVPDAAAREALTRCTADVPATVLAPAEPRH